MAIEKDCPNHQIQPRLRFPDFSGAGAWEAQPLRELAALIDERVGQRACIPLSVTSGVGLVTQIDKFGRTIAGKQYKNYAVLQAGDFAYNKSATKDFPQGFIAMYRGHEAGAVPTSIFTCFRANTAKINLEYLNHLFSANVHGKWLRQYITVGARAHGSLNVNDDDLLSLLIPRPAGNHSLKEQTEIAACLSSLDEVIAAETSKLEGLTEHRQGLMRHLFPARGEALPRLRLQAFQNAEEWRSDLLGEIFETSSGGTPNRSIKAYWNGNIPWITTSLVDFNVITEAEEFISQKGLDASSAKLFPKGTILVAMYGQGKTRGKVAMLGIEAATNQACAAILPRDGIDPSFVFLNLANRYDEMRGLSNSGGQENLSQALIRMLPFSFPADIAEQRRIVECLTPLGELISAQGHKIIALAALKQGLLQRLFPCISEVER